MRMVRATDHNGRVVTGEFVRHADEFNSVVYCGGPESIFVLRSSLVFI